MDGFNGLDEGLASLRYFFGRLPLFVWVGAGWGVLVGSYEWIGVHLMAYATGLIPSVLSPVSATAHLSPGFLLLAVVIPYRLLWLVAACAIAVAYHRAVIENERPTWPFAPLNRRWLRYFVSLIVVSIVLNQVARIIVRGDLSRPIPADMRQITPIISWLFIGLASLGGLWLAAIAVNNPTADLTASILATRTVVVPFIGGFLISSLPLFVLGDYLQVLNPLSPEEVSDIGSLVAGIASDFLSLGAVACGAIYLSRAYQRLSPTTAKFPDGYRRQ